MKVGIIGLPNVGKSTLFKALTKKQVDVSNYPFCTIDPNIGVVPVPDERLEKLAQVSKSEKVTPSVIEFVDIAGLVKNAHKGEGLGNQFLSQIREVDAVVEVLRGFKDENIIHVEGGIDPERDKSIIHLELIMADLQTVEKRLEKISKEVKSGSKEAIKISEVLEKLKKLLEDGKMAKELNLNDEEKSLIKDLNLLTLKPLIYVMNVSQESGTGNQKPGGNGYLYIDAKLESELAELPDGEVKEYLDGLGVQETGLDKLIMVSYDTLNLITFFTYNEKELRAWTIKKGTSALKAAGKVHTDFEKGFVKAEVCNWQDLVESGGMIQAKERGLVRVEGKNYIVQDGDVVYFRASVSK